MRRYLMEYVGTLFLVLAIGLATNLAAPSSGDLLGADAMQVAAHKALAPFAIGLTLAVMIYAGGHISGAHYNPAITLAVWLRGKCDARDVPGYLIAQLSGALTAALFVYLLIDRTFAPAPGAEFGPAFLAEILFTFALATVILNVATTKALAGNSFYGFAIGMTVTAGALCVGPISGAVFNPAVYLGPAILHHFGPEGGPIRATLLMLYLAGPCIGAAIAALVFETVNPDEFDQTDHH